MWMFLGLFLVTKAQTNVTFVVDMSGQTVSANGVHVAGSFQGWSPSTTMLNLVGGSTTTYSVTVSLAPGTYEYKFINGNSWGNDEGITAICNQPGSTNRVITVGTSDTTLMPVCFNKCGPCNKATVQFAVDMNQTATINPNGVHVAGSFQGWNPSGTRLSDPDGDGIFTAIAYIDTNTTIEYKYLNGNFWGDDETVPASCATNGNRTANIGRNDVALTAFCYGTCNSCVLPINITFRVDMSLQTVTPNGVHVAGDFQGWNPGATALTLIPGSNAVYETVVQMQPGTINFKFINGNSWGSDEGIPGACNFGGNRQVAVSVDTVLAYCFTQCASSCIVPPTPSNVTFRVDMTGVTVDPLGVFLMGNFTTPQWQGGAIAMTNVGNNVYEGGPVLISGMPEVQFKFVNGDVNTPANEENHDFLTNGCGLSNGIGGFNRSFLRTASDTALPTYLYNSCNTNGVGLQLVNYLQGVRVFPNPAQNQAFVQFNNPENKMVNLVITDLMGRVVKNINSNLETMIVERNQLANGIYILQLIVDGKLDHTQKLVLN